MIYPTAAAIVLVQIAQPPHMLPPPHFDHPFKGKVEVIWLTPQQTIETCTGAHPACTFSTHPVVCKIYINENYRGTWMEPILIKHETAHCNGWNASHSN